MFEKEIHDFVMAASRCDKQRGLELGVDIRLKQLGGNVSNYLKAIILRIAKCESQYLLDDRFFVVD